MTRKPPQRALTYESFRTGLTYREVYRMLWSPSSDPREWRHKGRGSVLGLWHQLKREMWREVERREDEASEQKAGLR